MLLWLHVDQLLRRHYSVEGLGVLTLDKKWSRLITLSISFLNPPISPLIYRRKECYPGREPWEKTGLVCEQCLQSRMPDLERMRYCEMVFAKGICKESLIFLKSLSILSILRLR